MNSLNLNESAQLAQAAYANLKGASGSGLSRNLVKGADPGET
jgi:hypothetical protein